MWLPLLAPAFVVLTTFAPSITALQALSNSPCAVQCGNVLSSTTGADIECQDSNFGTTPGSTFQSCIGCQLSSTYIDPVSKQTDLQLALYNLRYAVSWCLFGYPNNTNAGSTPCTITPSCGPLVNAFEYDSLSLGYCPMYPENTVHACKSCLVQQTSQFYLTNYATVLDAACQQQPVAGGSISIQGNPFSTQTVNITSPTATPTPKYIGANANLTLGAKIGIVIGGILLLLVILGFCIIWNGRRRRRRILQQRQRESGYDEDWRRHHNFEQEQMHGGNAAAGSQMQDGNLSAGGFFDSPQSTRPLVSSRPWGPTSREEESPLSAVGEKAYFSPYSSQYSSPVSASDQVHVIGREWPGDRKGGVGLGRSRSIDKVEREPDGDRIEMQNVAPVLLHPGNGRGQHTRLAEDDARRSDAV